MAVLPKGYIFQDRLPEQSSTDLSCQDTRDGILSFLKDTADKLEKLQKESQVKTTPPAISTWHFSQYFLEDLPQYFSYWEEMFLSEKDPSLFLRLGFTFLQEFLTNNIYFLPPNALLSIVRFYENMYLSLSSLSHFAVSDAIERLNIGFHQIIKEVHIRNKSTRDSEVKPAPSLDLTSACSIASKANERAVRLVQEEIVHQLHNCDRSIFSKVRSAYYRTTRHKPELANWIHHTIKSEIMNRSAPK